MKTDPENKIKSIISRSSSYVTKWSLRPSLLSQCRQIAANKNLAVFTWRETMSFPCERLLIYNLMSQIWHLIMLFQQLLSNNQGQHTNPPFDEVCLLNNRCCTTFETLQICLLGLRRWLTGIQWKSNMCQNKSIAMPDWKNTSLVFMWIGRARGGPKPAGIRRDFSGDTVWWYTIQICLFTMCQFFTTLRLLHWHVIMN